MSDRPHPDNDDEPPFTEEPAAEESTPPEISDPPIPERGEETIYSYFDDSIPNEDEESFLDQMEAYETAPMSTLKEELSVRGADFPTPEDLTDGELKVELWRLIRDLSTLDVYLYSTDHLSDRQLYSYLVNDYLVQEHPVLAGTGWRSHVDLVGSGSDEDTDLWLRFYADEETRKDWSEKWPQDLLPPKEKPPYDRDRHLPKAEE